MISLPASSAHRWMKCHGSARLVREPGALSVTTTDSAREGRCASWVIETVINGDATCADDMVGKVHADGWMVDQDMVNHLQPFIDTVTERGGAVSELETRCGAMVARIDVVSHTHDTIYIDDLKYGYRIVDPVGNAQLLCNMTGYFEQGVPDWCQRVVLGIYQPRALHQSGTYRGWGIERADIAYWLDHTRQIISRAMSAGTETLAGSWCYGCRRAHDCAALTTSVYDMWEPLNGDGVIATTGEQLSDELWFLNRVEDLLKARKSAVEADVEQRIKENQFVPGWQMQERHGKRKFNVDADVIQAMTGIDPTETTLCTPAELERRGASKEVVKMLTTTPNIGRKLAPVDDKSIGKMFGD